MITWLFSNQLDINKVNSNKKQLSLLLLILNSWSLTWMSIFHISRQSLNDLKQYHHQSVIPL